MTETVDAVVLGMGPGGEEVAGRLAEAGLRVVGIESALLGGECPYWGCVPTKMMIRAGNELAEGRRIPGNAGSSTVQADWSPVARRIRAQATDSWDDRVAVERFERKGGIFVRGEGRCTAPMTVRTGAAEYRARRALVIATGTRPSIPPIPGLDTVAYWTNHHAVETTEVPESLLVLGGGAIGAELAQVFARFGARVTVVEMAERLLPLEEPEAGALLAEVFAREGIGVRCGVTVSTVGSRGDGVFIVLDGGERLTAQHLLVATGRRAELGSLDLGAAGVAQSGRWLEVDGRMRAGAGVWAVGDITGRGAFTHVAMYQARIAAADILGEPNADADYRALPRVTFTDPEVGAAGMTEAEARAHGLRVRIGAAQVPSSARGWIHGPGNEGFIKLVEDADRGVLAGACSAGPCGGEVLSMLTLAIHAQVPTDELARMIYAYPTFHRAVEDALRDLRSH